MFSGGWRGPGSVKEGQLGAHHSAGRASCHSDQLAEHWTDPSEPRVSHQWAGYTWQAQHLGYQWVKSWLCCLWAVWLWLSHLLTLIHKCSKDFLPLEHLGPEWPRGSVLLIAAPYLTPFLKYGQLGWLKGGHFSALSLPWLWGCAEGMGGNSQLELAKGKGERSGAWFRRMRIFLWWETLVRSLSPLLWL